MSENLPTLPEQIKIAEDSVTFTFPICAVCRKNVAPQVVFWEGENRCVCWECQLNKRKKIDELLKHLPEGDVQEVHFKDEK